MKTTSCLKPPSLSPSDMSGIIKTDVTPKAVLHIKDVQDAQAGGNTRQVYLNAEAIPG